MTKPTLTQHIRNCHHAISYQAWQNAIANIQLEPTVIMQQSTSQNLKYFTKQEALRGASLGTCANSAARFVFGEGTDIQKIINTKNMIYF